MIMLCSDGHKHRSCLLPRYYWDLQAKIFRCIMFLHLQIGSACVLWCCRREARKLCYFICIQCWSLANQNKTFLSLQLFCCCCWCFFVSMFFQKSIRLDSRGSLLSKRNTIILKNLLNGSKVYEIYFLGISKNIFETSIFLSPSEGLLLIISGIRSSTFMKFYIFHFSLLLFLGGCFLKRLFTCWLRIHKLCLRTRVALQILSHKARHKIPMKYLISLYTHLYFHANVYAFSYIICIRLQKVFLAL